MARFNIPCIGEEGWIDWGTSVRAAAMSLGFRDKRISFFFFFFGYFC